MSDRDDPPAEPVVLDSARRESRAVLDHRIELVSEMDDIAMHTVRTSVLLIGILVSAAGIAGREGINSISFVSLVAFGAGGCMLILTIFYGVTMLTISNYPLGISTEQRTWARTRDISAVSWYQSLLRAYGEWNAEMRSVNEQNSNVLLIVQSLFIGGTTLIAAGTAYMVARTIV